MCEGELPDVVEQKTQMRVGGPLMFDSLVEVRFVLFRDVVRGLCAHGTYEADRSGRFDKVVRPISPRLNLPERKSHFLISI